MSSAKGYRSRHYASAFSEYGRPRKLNHSGGWILERTVPGGGHRDAMGLYPFFSCNDWRRLASDIEEIEAELVALSLVTDPMSGVDQEVLSPVFSDRCLRFKEHFVVDLNAGSLLKSVSTNHRRNARKALKRLSVERCERPERHLEEWCRFYRNLVRRHRITGITAFSEKAFARQFETPGLVVYRACKGVVPVGMILWYVNENADAYYHLGAYDDAGYETGASFALFWRAIEDFSAEGIRHLCLGAGAGATPSSGDGLTRFKKGWANTTRPVYFCGRIFNTPAYENLAIRRANPGTQFFPAYRDGEF